MESWQLPGEMAIDSGDVTASDSSLEGKQRETRGGVGPFQAEGTAEAEALQGDSLHHRHHSHSLSHLSGPPHVALGGNPRLLPSLALECKLLEDRPSVLRPQ